MNQALSQERSPARPKVLVVDDEAAMLRLMKVLLIRHGYEVETALTAHEALKLMNSNRFDLIITDAIMPNVSGFDLVKSIRRRADMISVPILMLTRKKARQDVKLALEAGVTDYALKPIDEHLLMDKVELCMVKNGAKRHVYECPVDGENAQAEVSLRARVVSISESDITVRLPFPVFQSLSFEFKCPLYDEIGIDPPLLRLLSCEELDHESHRGALVYEAKFAFTGMLESELQKIRVWLMRESVRKRK